MKVFQLTSRVLITMFVAVLGTPLFAQNASALLADADRIFELDNVYSRSTLSITRSGREQAPQVMEGFESDDTDGTSRSLTVFREPARVNGTAYLMIGDDLWVRFASTGRIRKMSSSAKKNSAAGSDFSYDDMGDGSSSFSSRYRPALEGTDRIDGVGCHRLILTPRSGERHTYEKLIVWLTEEDHRYKRIEYWEDGAPIKVMDLEDYRRVGNVDYPYLVTMRSLAKDSVSVIETQYMEFDSPKVEDRFFTSAYLESIR